MEFLLLQMFDLLARATKVMIIMASRTSQPTALVMTTTGTHPLLRPLQRAILSFSAGTLMLLFMTASHLTIQLFGQ
jgi:hypothetical protein